MKFIKVLIILIFLCLVSCSGGGKGMNSLTSLIGGDETPETTPIPETPPAEVETIKLQAALEAEPIYKIDNSEIEMMKTEGIITEEDVAQLQAIQ